MLGLNCAVCATASSAALRHVRHHQTKWATRPPAKKILFHGRRVRQKWFELVVQSHLAQSNPVLSPTTACHNTHYKQTDNNRIFNSSTWRELANTPPTGIVGTKCVGRHTIAIFNWFSLSCALWNVCANRSLVAPTANFSASLSLFQWCAAYTISQCHIELFVYS